MTTTPLATVGDDDPRLRALAYLVHAWRPGWDQPGIRAAIHAARRPGATLEQLQAVALATAQDRLAQTPAAIGHTARWETVLHPKPETTRPTPTGQACPRCGRVVVDPDEGHTCQPSEPTDAWREAREALRRPA